MGRTAALRNGSQNELRGRPIGGSSVDGFRCFRFSELRIQHASAHYFVAGGPHTLIYGPPAVRKLTIAKEVTALTGFGLFHNHATVDLVTSVFDRNSESFARLVWEIRLSVF